MNSFDNLTLSIPFSAINSYQEARFTNRVTKSGITLQECSITGLLGLNYIRRNEPKGEYVIYLTAKVLGPDYPSLLNARTIYQALERVRQTGLIDYCDVGQVVQEAVARTCHVTKDLVLPQALDQYQRMLKRLHVNTNYSITSYRNGNSLTFSKNTTTARAKEYAKFYGKSHELELAKNREYRESLSKADLARVRHYFHDKSRLELELTSGAKIREYFALPKGKENPIKLLTLLTSDAEPLKRIVQRLTAPIVLAPEVAQDKEFGSSLCPKEQSVFWYCQHYKFDLPAINYALREAHKKRPDSARTAFKKAQAMVCRYRAHQAQLTSEFSELLAELHQVV